MKKIITTEQLYDVLSKLELEKISYLFIKELSSPAIYYCKECELVDYYHICPKCQKNLLAVDSLVLINRFEPISIYENELRGYEIHYKSTQSINIDDIFYLKVFYHQNDDMVYDEYYVFSI